MKSEAHQACLDFISAKIELLKAEISDAQNSANSETKSSAGDKHETGRAQAQLTVERLNSQLSQWNQSLGLLNQIEKYKNNPMKVGQLFITNQANYYLSVGLGRVNEKLFAIGLNSPVGQVLAKANKGDKIKIGSASHEIKDIV